MPDHLNLRLRRLLPESYWARPGARLAGETPGAWDKRVAHRKPRRLLAVGVNALVDLTEAAEPGTRSYKPLLDDLAPGSLVHAHFPIRDQRVPTPHEMLAIMDTIDALIADGRLVYVHCRGGVGRTGTVIGCHLVRHGLTGEQALAHLALLRQATPDGHRPSPATPAQRAMVLA